MGADRAAGLGIDPRSGYCMADVVRLMMMISERPMGRTALVRRLGLGEASVRTMMKTLRHEGMVEQGTRGLRPTARGRSSFSFCARLSGPVDIPCGGFSKHAAVLVVRGGARKVRTGLEQRDEGVRHGAVVVTMVKREGKLVLAGVPDQEPPCREAVEKATEARDEDAVVLSGAGSRLAAERGAMAAGILAV